MAESLAERMAEDINKDVAESIKEETAEVIPENITEGVTEGTAEVLEKPKGKKKKKVKRQKVTVVPEKVKKMSLTKEERVGIILLCGSRSLRQTAEDFNKANPEREKITHSCVSKLLAKFRETGSILDKPHVAKKRVTDETTSAYILAKFSMNPSSSIRRMALETNVSKTSIRRILRANRVVTLSSLGSGAAAAAANSSTNYNYGECQNGGSDFPTAASAKKKVAKPRKPSAAKNAALNNTNNVAATATGTVTTGHQQQLQQHEQIANKWQQQHQQQQQQQQHQQHHQQHHHHQQQQHQIQALSNDGHVYMNEYKDLPVNDYQSGAQLGMGTVGLKSPKAHKAVAAQATAWNTPAVSYGYGAPLMYQPTIGYIDPVTQ